MRRALVTGGTGFIGEALVHALLAEGWVVQAVGRRPATVDRWAFDIRTASPAALRTIVEQSDCDTIFHLAGTTLGGDAEIERVNVGFAEALLNAAALAARRPGVLLAGTAAEYGDVAPDALPVREDHPCRPGTRYGASKLRQTELGIAAAAAGLTVHLPRMFNVIGRGMRPHLALGRFARDIAAMGPAGGVLTTGPLGARRDFIAVDEAARAMIELSRMPLASGQVVNFCSGTSIGMAEALDALIAAAGTPIRVSIDGARSGVSAVPDMVGCTGRRAALGLRIGVPDLAAEMAQLLKGYDPERSQTHEAVE